MNLLDRLNSRGLLQDFTDREGLNALAQGTPFYVGFDPTAPSLQIGNLVTILAAVHIARAGLDPIILFGGATGAIGDPSGKNVERQLLTRETIDNNVKNHSRKVAEIFERAGVSARFVNNYEWTKDLCVIDFLRDVGKHFTVNYMLAKDTVQSRLSGDGISFTEFSYMILQAFDYYHLHRTYGCRLQVGGSDQWGNITAGLELIRKKIGSEVYAFSWPLLLNSQGKKFGKSESGALWIDAAYTSPYRFHQFWLNVDDSDVIRYIKIFTFAESEQIAELEQLLKSAPEKRAAQHFLADSVTTLVHGESQTASAKRSATVLFGGSIDGFSTQELLDIFSEVPSSTMERNTALASTCAEILASSQLVKSKGEAKRLIQNGGAYLNNLKLSDPEQTMSSLSDPQAAVVILRSGKKNYHLLKLT